MKPRIIAHGGAWEWDDALDEIKQAVLREAVLVGYAVLEKGGLALDAVQETAVVLENSPVFDAGHGGYLNQRGIVQHDALLVDGRRHDFGAVGAATRVKNPIVLARKIMEETENCFIVGEGANQMAERLGLTLVENADHIIPESVALFEEQSEEGMRDTIGAVALDAHGNLAAATSTSGTPFKPHGRVGDSPLYGAGGYALNDVAAVGATGLGENIMRVLLSKFVADQVAAEQTAQEAANSAMRYVEGIFPNSMSGVIVIDQSGNLGAAHTTPKLAMSWIGGDGEVRTAVRATLFNQR